MVIDFHTHTFPKKIVVRTLKTLSEQSHMNPSLDGTREGLLRSMEKAGVDISVEYAVATSERQVEKLNDIAIEVSKAQDRILLFGSIHPEYENYEGELKRIKEAGLKGVKVQPFYQGKNLDDKLYINIFKACRDLELMVVAHTGDDIAFPGENPCTPKMAQNVLKEIPDLIFVLAHMGGFRQWGDAISILADSGAYYDTSLSIGRIETVPGESFLSERETTLMNSEFFVQAVEKMGYERVLYGTDSPWSDQSKTIDFIRNLEVSDSIINAILGENAKKLLKL